jgi:hypothetical protein
MGELRSRRNRRMSKKEKTLEILQSEKGYAKKCTDNFNEGTLNWLIGLNFVSFLLYIVNFGLKIYSLYHFHIKGDAETVGISGAPWHFG